MKRSWKLRWIISAVWLLIFITTELFILLRPVDGAGMEQPPALKVISSLMIISIFAFPTLILLIWLVVNLILLPRSEHKAVNR